MTLKKIQKNNLTSDQNGTHDFKILDSTNFQLVTKQEKQNLTLYFHLYLFLPTLQIATPINIFITLFYNKFTVNHHRIENYCVVFGLTFTFLQGLKKLHTSSENCNVREYIFFLRNYNKENKQVGLSTLLWGSLLLHTASPIDAQTFGMFPR